MDDDWFASTIQTSGCQIERQEFIKRNGQVYHLHGPTYVKCELEMFDYWCPVCEAYVISVVGAERLEDEQ